MVIGISANNQNQIDNFVEENGITYPILFDPGGSGGVSGGDTYDLYYLPSDGSPYPRDFIVDQNGIIQYANNEIDTEWMLIVLDDLLGGSEVEIDISFQENWNMIGLPLAVENPDAQFLFPESVENTLFTFTEGGYSQESILNSGIGYWLRFQTDGTSTISGQSLDELSIELTHGWNMISGISQT
ncbi:MAG TPA: redoxin domain-containing protein, partial [Candidatus Marinimicrobia bacterium]|nr:redoxin domain-containing protein [Candidatus Neomarinimicrobiota bacterium]